MRRPQPDEFAIVSGQSMNKLQQLLQSDPYVLLDGAMGTMLMEIGLNSGAPPEEWNTLHPQKIQGVHAKYIAAGSRVILTNSFGGTSYRLKLHCLQDRVRELNRAAAANARAAADRIPYPVVVGGSMGPTGELLKPLGKMAYEEAVNAFAEQASGLVDGGADLLWIETMSDINEVRAAVDGIRSVSDRPIVATMTFDTNGHTMMGVSPSVAIQALDELDVVAAGGNCGNGPQEIEGVIKAMRRVNPDIPLVAKSNAGVPKWKNEALIYDGSPEVMAHYAVNVRALGARLIGACCGSTPHHIRAMADALAGSPLVPLASVALEGPKESSARRAKAVRERRFRRRSR